MKPKIFIAFLSFLFSVLTFAQPSVQQIISSIPDKAATDDQLIYVHTIPEWDQVYSYTESQVDANKLEMADSYGNALMVLGLKSNSKGEKKLLQFDSDNLRFLATLDYHRLDLVKKSPTNEKDFFYSIKENRQLKSATLIETYRKRGRDVVTKSTSINDLLNSIERTGYTVEKMSSWLTQDKAHLLIDLEVLAKTLREDVRERLWLTLRLADLQVKNKISLNDTELNTGDEIFLQPLGLDDILSYNRYDRSSNAAMLVSPGTDLIFAKYRNRQFKSNWMVNVSINMVTGEVNYLAPPSEATIARSQEILRDNFVTDQGTNYSDALWLNRNYTDFRNEQIDSYEELIYYSEKERTYMTWSQISIPASSGIKLVMKSSQGEIVDRLPRGDSEDLKISRYIIRKMDTKEVMNEYMIIASLAHKISHDGKTMVSVEGENQVLTLRDRRTGKLLDVAPRTRSTDLYEVPSGFVLRRKLSRGIGYSLLKDPTTQSSSIKSSGGNDESGTEWESYASKFASFPRKYFGYYGGVTTEYANYKFSLALLDQSTIEGMQPKEEVGMLVIEHPQGGKSYSELTLKESKKGNLVLVNRKHRGDEEFRKRSNFFYLKLRPTKNPSEMKASTFSFHVKTSKHSLVMTKGQ